MLTDFRRDLRRNLQDYGDQPTWRRCLLALTLNSVHALALIRVQLWCARHRLPTLPVSKLLFYLFKIEISREARLGPGLRLPHPMGIIIGPRVELGEDCDVYADVRIVLSHGQPEGARIGNHVFLGDGAKIVGRVSIGDHAIIGVSSVVTRDVPAHATAAGIPAKIIVEHNNRVLEAA